MSKASEMIGSIAGFEYISKDQSYIYELYKGSECIYVGQTQSLLNRITIHIGQKEFDSIKVNICSKDEANENEAESIVRLNPKYNYTLPATYKYTTLKQFKQSFEKMFFSSSTTAMDVKFSYNGSCWITTEDAEILKTALIDEIYAINERKLHNRLKSSSRIREIESGLRSIASHRSIFSKEKARSQQGIIADLIADESERINKIYNRR